ncbi:MAG: hypothetical protein QGI00_01475 [Candidatus Marinimicrobia bacterium]|nr:hypothetical protein [Candidatus Neomarinimicrobiota bacterium]
MAKKKKNKIEESTRGGREFLQEISPVDEEIEESISDIKQAEALAIKVAEEPVEPELLVEESEEKMSKQEFLDSIGIGDRPGSHQASVKWEEYCAGI